MWSYPLSLALANIDLIAPTQEQVLRLLDASTNAWFFGSIFGLLDEFKQALQESNTEKDISNPEVLEESIIAISIDEPASQSPSTATED